MRMAGSEASTFHWDGHDVFIFQVSGVKQWMATAQHVWLRWNPNESSFRPTTSPPELFGRVTCPRRSVVPARGWWHAAATLDVPISAFNVWFHNRTGLDLFNGLNAK